MPSDGGENGVIAFLTEWLLYFNALMTIPFWTMGMGTVIFFVVFYFAPLWLRAVLVCYYVWGLIDQSHITGKAMGLSRESVEWWRHATCYHLLSRYMPIRLHKTVDIPADTPYIFLCHPHGVVSVGCCTAVMGNASGFDSMFPGIWRRGVTLNLCFYVPIAREWILAQGVVGPNIDTLKKQLDSGTSIAMVPGGAAEALLAHKSKFQLVSHRRGVFRLALQSGAKVVPVLAYGENHIFDTYDVKPGSFLHTLQKKLTKLFSFSVPFLVHPFVKKHPIDVVVGAPVCLETQDGKQAEASKDNIEELHRIYWASVRELYESNKSKFGFGDIPLEFIR